MEKKAKALLQAFCGVLLCSCAGAAPLADSDTLHTDGPALRNARNERIVLSGVNIASLEWTPKGERIRESFAAAIEDWGAKLIRLPVRSGFWFGRDSKQPLPDDFSEKTTLAEKEAVRAEAYRTLVDSLLEYANARGCYVILDLHEFKAPTAAHLAFWRDAATRYANRPGVLFGLLNEPHSISWDEWRNGGSLSGKPRRDAIDENWEQIDLKSSVGMQAVLDAVRATGARNIAVVGGLDWGYDLSGIENGFALSDPTGNGILYDTHIYPWKNNWAEKVLCIAEKYPILVGEVGCMTKPMPFETEAKDPYAWAPDALAFIQKHRFSYTAWCFHPTASPCIISDWNYTPTPYWGAFVRAALRGARFVSDHLH